MSPTQSPEALDAEQVNELARNFWYSAILRAGIKLNVFSLLDSVQATSSEVAHRIGGSPRYVEAFLESCVVLGLLNNTEGKYDNTPLTARFLVKGRPEYVGDHAIHHTNTWATWGRLDELIIQGKTLLPFESGYVDADTYWKDYMIGQHNRATSGQADQLVKNVDLKGKHKLVDLGGGAASYTIALCQAFPELTATVVDRIEPLSIAKPLVEESGLQERITLQECDFLEADLGNDYDVALISGIVLIKPEADCRALLQVAYNSLASGGLLIVQDYMRIDFSSERKRLDTLEDLYVLVAFDPGARDREGEEVASWLRETGFRNTNTIPLPTQLALVTGEKP